MPEADRNALLLGSLRGLVRGLSALFWGLPITLVLAVQTAKGDWAKSLGFVPLTGAAAMLFYGTLLLTQFQAQERIWTRAVERLRIVALLNLGLAPFLFFWSKIPGNLFFTVVVDILAFSLLVFLYLLNVVITRLVAMLPDETLRGETRIFTRLNQSILILLLATLPCYFLLRSAETLPRIVVEILVYVEQGSMMAALLLVMFFILLPVAMTMALLWKTKEVIMTGVFSNRAGETAAPPPASP